MAVEVLKEKNAWKLYASNHAVDNDTANLISKYIDEYNLALKHAEDDEKDLINIKDYIPEKYYDIYMKSRDYQGIVMNLKVHACFTKDQLVLTESGYKKIQDVKIGDYVLTHDNSYQQVLDTQCKYSDDIYSLKIFGDKVEATGNHKFYIRTNIGKSSRVLSEPIWKELKNITKNDWVGSPINQNSIIPHFISSNKTHKNEYLDLSDKNIWWMIGRYMGDGWTENPRKNANRVIICCNKNGNELNDIINKIPTYLHYRVEEHRTSYKIHFDNKTLFDYLQQFGKYAYGKKITNDVLDLPIDFLREFLDGYLSADGSHTGKYITFTTVSKELAYGIQQCVEKAYRRPCTLITTPPGKDMIEGREVNRRKKYRGKFKLYEDKKDVNKCIGDCIWYKVREIEKINKQELVYNLSVNNTNSYTVNNLSVHNCGFLIFNGDIRREIGLVSAISESTGKRTLVACVEGKYLDSFGYTKEDFLVVDSVSLTYELFKSIGESVPSFETLREMVDGDESTWDIYANGITCCVNQCEQPKTVQKMKKYKAKSILELAAFVAGIRPGFASLINTFINREPYSTGEEKIDKLLESSSHFILYQELIMKVLSFLGLPMGETYGIIKSISKKKLKGEKKEHLLRELKEGWMKQFGNLDNFQNVWKVIEDSASYAFNAPHAYAMAGDSLYQAWFKAHHTPKFYEVAIAHYQKKNKKDKIDALIKEAMKFYNYKLGDYEFGVDNRSVTIDDKNKIIYPNLSSVKGFGESVVESLYTCGQKEYNNFIEVIKTLEANSVNKTIIEKLILINYFKKYGKVNKLLKINEYYNLLYGAKQLSKDKIIKNGLSVEFVSKYGNETAKQVNKLDSLKLLNDLIDEIPDKDRTSFETLKAQYDVLGIVTYVNKNEDKRHYFVTGVDRRKSIVNISLYEVYSGKNRNVKLWTSQFDRKPFAEGEMINLYGLKKQQAKEPTGEIGENGKKVYKPVPDKFEFWLESWDALIDGNYV